jgi:hypothetical protein
MLSIDESDAVPDVEGYDLKPNPLTAEMAGELVAALREYRTWGRISAIPQDGRPGPPQSRTHYDVECIEQRSHAEVSM